MTRLTPRTTAIGALCRCHRRWDGQQRPVPGGISFRIDWLQEPTRSSTQVIGRAAALRAALDLIGYYLATGVLAYALWWMLRPGIPSWPTSRRSQRSAIRSPVEPARC